MHFKAYYDKLFLMNSIQTENDGFEMAAPAFILQQRRGVILMEITLKDFTIFNSNQMAGF